MSFNSSGCAESEPYALRVLGDSMLPEFEQGAIIVIDPAGAIKDGCYVIAIHDDEYIFRQLRIHEDRYYLRPLNDLYDVVEIPDLGQIKGVISQKSGRRRKDHKRYDR